MSGVLSIGNSFEKKVVRIRYTVSLTIILLMTTNRCLYRRPLLSFLNSLRRKVVLIPCTSCVVDERRQKILEIGGAEVLVKMLSAAKDDRTRKEALKALSALSGSG